MEMMIWDYSDWSFTKDGFIGKGSEDKYRG